MDQSTPIARETAARAPRGGRRAKTFGYYAAFIALGLSAASLGPTLPGLAAHTRSQISAISFLFTARALGYMLGSFLGGRGYDRLRGHPIMGGVLLVMAAMLALVPIIPILWLLTAALLLLGMAEGTLDVGGNTLMVWVHRREVGPYMNGLHFFFGVGALISPLIVGQAVALSGDVTWAYWGLAVLMLPAAFWLWYQPSPHAPEAAAETDGGPANRLVIGLTSLFFLLYVGAEGSFGGWIYTYAVSLRLSDAVTAAYLTSAFWGALTFGRLVGIPVAARFTPRAILTAELLGSLLGVGVIVAWPTTPLAVWGGTFITGFAMASVFPVMISLAERRLAITGSTTGWFFVGASAGGMLVPWLIGQLFEVRGPQIVMTIIFVDLLLNLAVFGLLLAIAQRRNEEGRKSGTEEG